MSDIAAWSMTVGIVLALLVLEYFLHIRKPHAPSFREAVGWSIFYISISLVFGATMVWWRSSDAAVEYLAGFVTEKSLSVDNLFVFLIILGKFAVPPAYRQRVLMFGIVLALILRVVFIVAGAAALNAFSWVFYLFGAFLFYTAVSVAREGEHVEEGEYQENAFVRMVRRVLPVAGEYHGTRLVAKVDGKRMLTPLLMVMLAIGTTDVLFALDSIPAIFGLTEDPFIVFAANAFALLGLRQLFFVVDGLLKRLVYLAYGLAIILGFIAVKLILHALHLNTLPFINGGHPVEGAPEIGTLTSLAVIVGVLTVTTVWSAVEARRRVRVAEDDAAVGKRSDGAAAGTGEGDR